MTNPTDEEKFAGMFLQEIVFLLTGYIAENEKNRIPTDIRIMIARGALQQFIKTEFSFMFSDSNTIH